MIVDLVKTTTADQLRLDGALHTPPHNATKQITIDAVILFSGVGGNFYGSSLLEEITPPLLDLDIAVLWANTRGHDAVYTASFAGKRRRQGAAYESVDECRLDVAAWIEFLLARGYRSIGLFGHSLGAIKVIYSQAHQPHEAVDCVIGASPPRLSCACFNNAPESPIFFETLATAKRHVEQGNPNTLIEARFPFPLLITAGGYVDKYGPAERYNIVRFANRVRVPSLFVYGAVELAEGGIAFAGVPDALAALPNEGQQFHFATVREADHMYTGVALSLSNEVIEWLQRNFRRAAEDRAEHESH